MGVTNVGIALGLDGENLRGVVEDGFLGGFAEPLPLRSAQLAQSGGFFPEADVAGHEMGLIEGDVELGFVGVFDDEDLGGLFGVAIFVPGGFEAVEPADAVFFVDDEVVGGEIDEVHLGGAGATLAIALEDAPGAGLVIASEDFRVRDNREVGARNDEALIEMADESVGGVGGDFDEFGEAFLLALAAEDESDLPPIGIPFRELFFEEVALGFLENKVASFKAAKRGFVAGG